jgi:Ni,Fe-hydrogenase I cytochrome b subunit
LKKSKVIFFLFLILFFTTTHDFAVYLLDGGKKVSILEYAGYSINNNDIKDVHSVHHLFHFVFIALVPSENKLYNSLKKDNITTGNLLQFSLPYIDYIYKPPIV